MPGFYDYMGYLYFYPTANMGPCFEYKAFIDFVELNGNYKNMPVGYKNCGYELLWGVFYLAGYRILNPIYPSSYLLTEEFG